MGEALTCKQFGSGKLNRHHEHPPAGHAGKRGQNARHRLRLLQVTSGFKTETFFLLVCACLFYCSGAFDYYLWTLWPHCRWHVLACRPPPACLSRLQRPTTAKQPGQGSLLIQIPQSMPLTPSGWPWLALGGPWWSSSCLDGTSIYYSCCCLPQTAPVREATNVYLPPSSCDKKHDAAVSPPGPQTKTCHGLSAPSSSPSRATKDPRGETAQSLSAMCTDRSHSGPIDQRHHHRERTTHPPIWFRPELVASGRRPLFVANEELHSPHHREPAISSENLWEHGLVSGFDMVEL